MYVAEHYLGLEVEERDVYFDEVKDFAECGPLRNSSCNFPGRQGCKSRRGDLLPQRNGEDGTDDPENCTIH